MEYSLPEQVGAARATYALRVALDPAVRGRPPAERLYGEELGSNYQGQVTMLSKHFEEVGP